MQSIKMSKLAVTVGAESLFDPSLVGALKKGDFEVEHYETIENFLLSGLFDRQCLYLISSMTGNISAIDLIKLIRVKDKISLVLAMTQGREEVVPLLQAGADICSKLPLHVPRLLLEIQNYFKKVDLLTKSHLPGGVEFLKEGNMLIRNGKAQRLTFSEFRIIEALFSDVQKTHSRTELLTCLGDSAITFRTVDVHISSLRKKIEELDLGVETIRGSGYRVMTSIEENKK